MILVIGDIIVDEFVWGDVSRISPEAPVPVVAVEKVDRRLGGSANVVRNLHSLGQRSAMVGVVGDDEPGNWVRQRLGELDSDACGVLVKRNNRPTAIKTRVIARHQQVVRFDHEWAEPVRPETRMELLNAASKHLPNIEAVVISDYGKGVITPEFLTSLIPSLKDIIVAVDPKPEHTDAYAGATVITPNLQEAASMSGFKPENTDEAVEAMAKTLHGRLGLRYVLITRSDKGMSLFDGITMHHIPTAALDVFDVTGAGDTVIAVLATCLARGDDALSAAKLANRAAGVVVGKVGTATATWEEIEAHPCG